MTVCKRLDCENKVDPVQAPHDGFCSAKCASTRLMCLARAAVTLKILIVDDYVGPPEIEAVKVVLAALSGLQPSVLQRESLLAEKEQLESASERVLALEEILRQLRDFTFPEG